MLKNNKGIGTLLVVTVIAVVLAIVGAGVMKLSYGHYKIIKEKSVDKERAYHFALGGIQEAVYDYQKGGDFALEDAAGNSKTINDLGSSPHYLFVSNIGSSWEGLSGKMRIIAACKKSIDTAHIYPSDHPTVDLRGCCKDSSVGASGICVGVACADYYPGKGNEYFDKLKPGDYVIESVVNY